MNVKNTVIVFGATSYVGQHVISSLLNDAYNVVAVSRDRAKCSILLADNARKVSIVPLDDPDAMNSAKPLAIINLAYVKDAPSYAIHRRNQSLIKKVVSIADATSCERLIHVSTQAVFGLSFNRTPTPTRVSFKHGSAYEETKLLAEELLLSLTIRKAYSLSIIRPGNVIGPGSPVWIAALAQKILEGRPVGYQNRLGYSNTTYVKNLAHYISFLLKQTRESLNQFGCYHHLAEFSLRPWRQILEYLSSVIGKNFKLISFPVRLQSSRQGTVGYRITSRLKEGRVGSYVKLAANRFISERFFGDVISPWLKRLYVAQPHLGAMEWVQKTDSSDRTLFEILSEKIRFESHVHPTWSAPFTFEDALKDIGEWLRKAGYVV